MPRVMTHYRSNVRDIVLDLFELVDSTAVYGADPLADVDTKVALSVLSRADRYARLKLAETPATSVVIFAPHVSPDSLPAIESFTYVIMAVVGGLGTVSEEWSERCSCRFSCRCSTR
jgi:hypothetical protein